MTKSDYDFPRDALFTICVDNSGPPLAGRVYSVRQGEVISFSDGGNLLLQLEALFDAQNCPSAFLRARAFGGKPKNTQQVQGPYLTSGAVAAAPPGACYTCQVAVETRQKATWQGTVFWADNTKTPFQSALELMGLLENHSK